MASIVLGCSTSEQSPLCSDAFFMPTRAHAQKASSASPSPPSKTVPFCAGPGLKARCCPARCPQSPSTPSKLQSPSTPSKKKRARPKAHTHKEVIVSCRTVWQIAMLSCFFSAVQWSARLRPASVPRRSSR